MHLNEVDTDASLVRRLIAAQFPDWADLAVEAVDSWGTDNALYRLGQDLVARLPRTSRTEKALAKEIAWLPRLAPLLPLAVPTLVVEGMPGEGYPFEWAVYGWLAGEDATSADIADFPRTAGELAEFVAVLHGLDPTGGPAAGEHNVFRGEPLAARDAATRAAIDALRDELDAAAVTAVWESALDAPEWGGAAVWIHGDLDARNLLVDGGRLVAVIDWGCLGVGDPACDYMVAWKVLSADSRSLFLDALSVDAAAWARARGWALSQAVGALSYYTLDTNPSLVREGQRWLAEVLAD